MRPVSGIFPIPGAPDVCLSLGRRPGTAGHGLALTLTLAAQLRTAGGVCSFCRPVVGGGGRAGGRWWWPTFSHHQFLASLPMRAGGLFPWRVIAPKFLRPVRPAAAAAATGGMDILIFHGT